MDSPKHYIREIREAHEQLDHRALAHIEICPLCRSEYEVYRKIEHTVQHLPQYTAPLILRDLILQRVIRPAYKLWHLFLGLTAAILSPMVLVYLDRSYQLIYMGDRAMMYTFIMYGVLVPGVIMPLSSMLFRRYRATIEHFSDNVDAFLEKHGQ